MADSVDYAAAAGLMLLAAGEVPNFLAGMLPSLMTIRRFGADQEDRDTLRRGEIAGSALSIMVGVGASLAADSWLPLLSVLVILGIMLYMYEEAIRNPHAGAKPINDPGNLPS
ncbi:MAG: hypothetical protein JSR64_17035 [Nitrospira sp.]|nr:hypothetical protein [Nitrospira sp.]